MTFLVPPKSVTSTSGSFTFAERSEIASIHPDDRIPVLQLINDLASLGCTARSSADTSTASVVLVRKRSMPHPEGYVLSIAPGRVEVAAATPAGAYYGVQTLREIIASEGLTIPAMVVRDQPDFSRRAYYLDCSRGKVPTVSTITQLVERLAHWKINELQLYVENVFTFSRHPEIGVGFSPLTPEDIITVREHCRLHHVDFVPSLTSLGHFEKILMLPEYQDLGELPGFRGQPGGTTLNPLDPRSIELVADMFAEFLPLFTAEDFNACGDEPWELGQGRSKARAQEVGLGRVYLDFIMQLRDLSVEHGKRMNLWGDIVLKHPEIIKELPPELVVLNWDYAPDGGRVARTNEFVDAGLPLVCCPGTHGWQSHGTRLRTSMRNIHQFAGVALEAGAEGILNTDWGDNGHRNTLGVSLHGAAYGAACSWNWKDVPGPLSDDFTRAFVLHAYADGNGLIAPVIATIGNDDYGQWAYHALLESLARPAAFGEGVAGTRIMMEGVGTDDETLRRMIDAADALVHDRTWMAVPDGWRDRFGEARAFEATALEEYALANLMNRAAARRVILSRAIRSGASPDRTELDIHHDELAEIRDQLDALWHARNRPSRLNDSLTGLDAAIEETRRA